MAIDPARLINTLSKIALRTKRNIDKNKINDDLNHELIDDIIVFNDELSKWLNRLLIKDISEEINNLLFIIEKGKFDTWSLKINGFDNHDKLITDFNTGEQYFMWPKKGNERDAIALVTKAVEHYYTHGEYSDILKRHNVSVKINNKSSIIILPQQD